MSQIEVLQMLTRKYLSSIKEDAEKIGLGKELKELISQNEKGKCFASKEQVDKLSRFDDDDKIKTAEIPEMLGISYRKLFEQNLLEKIRVFEKKGMRSKVDVEILKDKLKK